MITSTIIAVLGVMSLLWTKKVRNNFTKIANLTLGLSAIAYAIPNFGISSYAPFFFGFFSLLASFESTNSFHLKRSQVIFFVLSGLIFAALTVSTKLPVPFDVPYWIFSLVFFIGLVYHLAFHSKKIHSRIGVLLAWSGMALFWIVSQVLLKF